MTGVFFTAMRNVVKQVVQDESEVGLARPVVGQRGRRVGCRCFVDLLQQRLDELVQVVNLFQLAPRVLVQPALARQDMQLFVSSSDWPGRSSSMT